MKFGEWLELKGMSRGDCAKALNASRRAIDYWISGERLAGYKIQKQIADLTAGAVTAADHYETRKAFMDEKEGLK
jgi:transcriptional regulator with XRE-family HTH domain